MKIYFDNLDLNESNCNHLTYTIDSDYWVVAPGSNIKKVITSLGYSMSLVDSYEGPGVYIVDVRGDPDWWAGVLRDQGTPRTHIIELVPKHIKDRIRLGQLRLIVAADREGGPMAGRFDCFAATTQAMRNERLPVGSVLIMQGNKKIEKQYTEWLEKNNEERLFEVMYSNHFGHIFVNQEMTTVPLINTNSTISFNSLNRVYRHHRGAHLFTLASKGMLKQGMVSCNELRTSDEIACNLADTTSAEYRSVMLKNFPLYIDGDWSVNNAANQYNAEIYKNTLMSFITETIFLDDVAFITEKIFKPMMLGHPLILLASAGTLAALREMGFRTDWCGIDPGYNDIVDNKERFDATHKVLFDWIDTPHNRKVDLIKQSMPTIDHNFMLLRTRDFYKEAVSEALNRSLEYFNAKP